MSAQPVAGLVNTAPLNADERARFIASAQTIDFSALPFPEQALAKTILAGILFDVNATTNAPFAINTTITNLSPNIKRIFNEAFDRARVAPTTANGTNLPSTSTVMTIAGVAGVLIGIGFAIILVD